MEKTLTMIDDLILRYISGSASEEEKQRLLTWLNESPENRTQLFVLKDIHDAARIKQLFREANAGGEWERLHRLILSRTRAERAARLKKYMRHIARHAAIFLMGTLTAGFIYRHSGQPETAGDQSTAWCEVHTEKGEKVKIILPDGSEVKLNACSYLAYPGSFGKNKRELRFHGEGYFDVRTDPDIPFTVKTSGLQIKAFGTVFNVKAYENDGEIETTLVEGSVSIETDNNKPIVTLMPKQSISIPKILLAGSAGTSYADTPAAKQDTVKALTGEKTRRSRPKAILTDQVRAEVYTSWKDDKWVIESESMESLMKKIDRRYDVSTIIENETIKKYVFSGTLKNYSLEQVLEAIRLNAPVKFSVKEKQVVISEDKQLKKNYERLIQSP
jgi:ferric-dicitrate binding protein FerR (iron transport regulator)